MDHYNFYSEREDIRRLHLLVTCLGRKRMDSAEHTTYFLVFAQLFLTVAEG